MGVAAVFIDGGYLDKVMYYDFSNARINYEALAHELVQQDELFRTYYYNCLPYQSNPPTDEERQRYASKRKFTTALSYLPRFEVRLGKLAFRGNDEDGDPIFIQKRVDCMVGVDMAFLAGKGKVTSVILLSGDGDLIPAIEAVKREGVLAVLWHGSLSRDTAPSRELFEICDERRQITKGLVDRILWKKPRKRVK